jgi:LysM repeat protein|tara:strand:+ start:231 stop:1457 length:1227 start_codon:yes stop_codon:yes gene_type:complete
MATFNSYIFGSFLDRRLFAKDGGGDPGDDDNNSSSASNAMTVQAGDTLSQIAQANNTTVDAIAAANNISDVNQIQAGQNLSMPTSNTNFNTVSDTNTSDSAGSNTTRMDIANSITKNDGTTYKDGILYNDSDNSQVTYTTPYQNLADAFTPNDGTTYNQGQLVDGNDNTLRQNVANSITGPDGMVYQGGNLYNEGDGSLVTDNTSYQDLTNLVTPFDGSMYEDGQLTQGTGASIGTAYIPPPPTDNDDDTPATTTATTTDTTTEVDTDTTETETAETDTTGTDTVDYTDLVEVLESFTPGGQSVTSLPDEYLTQEDLEKYLANLDLGSNAYDPAAFLNAYGFALDGTQNNLIANTSPSSGVFTRRAVKDRETGEIRYVNVPVGSGAIDGNNGASQFRLDRRNGFASMV